MCTTKIDKNYIIETRTIFNTWIRHLQKIKINKIHLFFVQYNTFLGLHGARQKSSIEYAYDHTDYIYRYPYDKDAQPLSLVHLCLNVLYSILIHHGKSFNQR